MESTQIPLSVIMPVYNTAEKFLRKAIDSVLRQTYKNFEFIIINDGSTNNAEEIILNYKNTDNRIKYIKQANGGQSNARNNALKVAEGKYITFVDADDWIEFSAFQKAIPLAEENNLDILCFDNLIFNNQTEELIGKFNNLPNGCSGKICKDYKDPLIFDNLFLISNPCWGKLFKHEFLIQNNLFFVENLTFEDTEFYFRYIFKAHNIGFIKNHLYFYRTKQEGSVTMSGDERYYDLVKVFELIEKTLEEQGLLEKFKVEFCDYKIDIASDLIHNVQEKYKDKFTELVKDNLKKTKIPESDLRKIRRYNEFIHYLLKIKK